MKTEMKSLKPVKVNKNELNNILELSWGFGKSAILISSFELGIFDLIENGWNNAKSISKKLDYSETGLIFLLDSLYKEGLLKRENNQYLVQNEYKKYLCTESEYYIGHLWKLHKEMNWQLWDNLSSVIKSGKPTLKLFSATQDKNWDVVIPYLNSLAKCCAEEVSKYIDDNFTQKQCTVLDIGCGSGIYSQCLIKDNLLWSGTGVDQGNVLDIAKKQTSSLGLDNRLTFIEGDIFNIDYPKEKYDIVLISNILHGYSNEESRLLLSKAHKALKPSGILLVNEFINDTDTPSLLPLLFSLQFLMVGNGGAFSKKDLRSLITSTGFKSLDYVELSGPYNLMSFKKD